jgi:hypothetical protein
MRNAYRGFVGKTEDKSPFGRLRRRQQDNIKMGIKNRKRMYWTQGKDQWMVHEDGKEPTALTKG